MAAYPLISAKDLEPAQLHSAFTSAFADYLAGPFQVPPERWTQFLARQGADLGLSRVALSDQEPVAFCLVAPRPGCGSWRLATMGAVPKARGSGAAPALLEDFMLRARRAGTSSVELECFAQNVRARRLYESHGFREVDALHGYERIAPAEGSPAGTPPAVDLQNAFVWLDRCIREGCELPLQVTAPSLQAQTANLHAWRLRGAQLIFDADSDGIVHVHSLVDREQGQHDAQELIARLLASHPSRIVRVHQLQRHQVGGAALERLGFGRLPLHQIWMKRCINVAE